MESFYGLRRHGRTLHCDFYACWVFVSYWVLYNIELLAWIQRYLWWRSWCHFGYRLGDRRWTSIKSRRSWYRNELVQRKRPKQQWIRRNNPDRKKANQRTSRCSKKIQWIVQRETKWTKTYLWAAFAKASFQIPAGHKQKLCTDKNNCSRWMRGMYGEF